MNNLTSVYQQWSPRMLSIMRIMIAALFMEHGCQKLFGFPGGHVVPVFSFFGFGGLLEFVGGALLLIGLVVRPAAFILCGEMAVAYFMAHAPSGFFPVLNKGELAVVYCFVFLYLAVAGGGVCSLDYLRQRAKPAQTPQKAESTV